MTGGGGPCRPIPCLDTSDRGENETCAPHFTAPNVSPCTSCRWLNQPNTSIGATAIVEAADSLAKNRPSGLENDAMNAVSGAAPAEVRFRLQNASFQHRINDSRPVEA